MALTNPDRVGQTAIKVEDRNFDLQSRSNDESITADNVQSLDNESSSDGALDEKSHDEGSSSDEFPDDATEEEESSDESSSDESNSNGQMQKIPFRPLHVAKAMRLPSPLTPPEVFVHSVGEHPSRMVRRSNPTKEILIYTSGQCFGRNKNKGIAGCAGCAFIFESAPRGGPRSVRFALEQKGPGGVNNDLDQRTAELRALVATLE